MDKNLALKPRLSEKAYALSEERNTYIFAVPANISRQSIAKAVAAQYNVNVVSVRTASQPGKNRRSYRRGGRVVHRGQSPSIRKAYVRLKDSDKLPIFSAIEDGKPAKKESK